MRMKEITRYLDRDALADQIEALQERLASLRELIPYRRRRRGYGLPTALALGGIAALGLIVVGSLVVRRQLADRNR